MTATSEPRTRRALLGAGLGALAATAASALGRPQPASAGHGDVHLGAGNTATATTTITNTTTNESAIWGNATAPSGSGVGVRGDAAGGGGSGVWGNSLASPGVRGTSRSSAGLLGSSERNVGVYGVTGSDLSAGVMGETSSPHVDSTAIRGNAIAGRAVVGTTWTGIGMAASAFERAGVALKASGRVQLSTSGVATIAAGARSVTVAPGVDVGAASFVLLTPRVNISGRDLWYTTNATADTFTIRMSATRSKPTKVAWLLLG